MKPISMWKPGAGVHSLPQILWQVFRGLYKQSGSVALGCEHDKFPPKYILLPSWWMHKWKLWKDQQQGRRNYWWKPKCSFFLPMDTWPRQKPWEIWRQMLLWLAYTSWMQARRGMKLSQCWLLTEKIWRERKLYQLRRIYNTGLTQTAFSTPVVSTFGRRKPHVFTQLLLHMLAVV